MQGPDPDMSQSLELVKMEEGNRYMAVMTDDDGGLNYLCEGSRWSCISDGRTV